MAIDFTVTVKDKGGASTIASASIYTRVKYISADTELDSLTIGPGEVFEFDPDVSVTLTLHGNLICKPGSKLIMKPSSYDKIHRIVWPDIDEIKFVGGGMEPLDTDIGLWCIGDAKLDLVGSARTSWRRAVSGLVAGSNFIELREDVVGWQPGDELVIAPTAHYSVSNFWTLYDYPKVKSIEGRIIHLDRQLQYDHPSRVSNRDGRLLTAEIMNLTNNVQIEGTPTGRAHIMIMPEVDEHGHHGHHTGKQIMNNVTLRWLGPRQPTGEANYTKGVLGRYPLHFHHCGDGSRGSLLTNLVARDCGNHAFVPHMSHGIEHIGCLAHNTIDDPFWWDQMKDNRTPQDPSHNTLWRNCGVTLVTCVPNFRGYRLTGFNLGNGDESVCSGSFAVGVQGNGNASGFLWPEGATSVWQFDDSDGRNVAHNNKVNGIFTWQNTENEHVVKGFDCWHNGRAGVEHGAYVNPYKYVDGECTANARAPFLLHSQSHCTKPQAQVILDMILDADGKPHAFEVTKHTLFCGTPTELRGNGCRMVGHTKSALGFTYFGENGPSQPELIDVYNDCKWDNLLIDDAQFALMLSGSRVRLISATTGEVLQEWVV